LSVSSLVDGLNDLLSVLVDLGSVLDSSHDLWGELLLSLISLLESVLDSLETNEVLKSSNGSDLSDLGSLSGLTSFSTDFHVVNVSSWGNFVEGFASFMADVLKLVTDGFVKVHESSNGSDLSNLGSLSGLTSFTGFSTDFPSIVNVSSWSHFVEGLASFLGTMLEVVHDGFVKVHEFSSNLGNLFSIFSDLFSIISDFQVVVNVSSWSNFVEVLLTFMSSMLNLVHEGFVKVLEGLGLVDGLNDLLSVLVDLGSVLDGGDDLWGNLLLGLVSLLESILDALETDEVHETVVPGVLSSGDDTLGIVEGLHTVGESLLDTWGNGNSDLTGSFNVVDDS